MGRGSTRIEPDLICVRILSRHCMGQRYPRPEIHVGIRRRATTRPSDTCGSPRFAEEAKGTACSVHYRICPFGEIEP